MDGCLIYAGIIVGVAAMFALRLGWWLGLPASVIVALLMLILSASDYAALAGLAVAAISGAKLPRKQRLIGISLGIILSAAFWYVVPSLPDSPVNLIVAACSGSFTIGALVASLAYVAGRTSRRATQS
jgi:signal transduction histidine kinase